MINTKELPVLYIKIGGRNVNQNAIKSIESIIVAQNLCLPSYCELQFVQQNLLSLGAVKQGDSITVSVENPENFLFEGDITACEHQYTLGGNQKLIIRAYDLLHRLRKRQQVRQFTDTKLNALVSDVVKDIDINVAWHGSTISIAQSYQWRQSDLAMITENCQRYGYYFSLWGDTLNVFPLSSGFKSKAGKKSLQWMKNLLGANVELNTDPACRKVDVFGWNPHRAASVVGKASGHAGPEISADTHPRQVGVDGNRIITAQALDSPAEAMAVGQAMIDQRRMGEAIFQGVAEGDADLRPGVQVLVEGLQDDLNGQYVLSSVQHNFDRLQGYVCELSTAPPQLVERQALYSSLGIVADINDPDKLGRVKVKFPELCDLESLWLAIVHPGAGQNKGIVAMPDVNDRVLVFFVDGDPTRGVIIGGLYGENGPPDTGISGGKVKTYTFTTPQGQTIQLNDDKSSVHLKNSDGSYIDLSPSKVTIHSDTKMLIEAPGKAMTIRASSIDFEKG